MGPLRGVLFDTLWMLLGIIEWLILIWVLLSWVLFFARQTQFRWRHRQFYGVLEQLNDIFERMTRPLLRPFRRFLRRFDTAGIDWSPMLLLILIWLLRRIIMAYAAPRILLP